MADIFAASSDEEGGEPGPGRAPTGAGASGAGPAGVTAAVTAGVAEAAQRRELHDAGYRDGAGGPEGHARGLQEGFDVGFAEGLADGRALGRVLGALSGVDALAGRVPRGLPGPPLPDADRQRLQAALGRLAALAPTMCAAADPTVARELAEAVGLLEAAGVCDGAAAVEKVLGTTGAL